MMVHTHSHMTAGPIPVKTESLRVLLTNAFGLKSKLGEFHHILKKYNVDIAIVTETKFTADKVSAEDVLIPGFQEPFRLDRSCHGGGIGVWIRSSLAAQQLVRPESGEHELMWLSLRTGEHDRLVIGATYRPGSCSDTDTTLLDHIDECLDEARCAGSRIILAGDFNVHSESWLGSTKTTKAGDTMEEIAAAHGLSQHVSGPTRGDNTLDLILSDYPGSIRTHQLPPLGRSDHNVILADFPGSACTHSKPTERTVWRYKTADWDRLRAYFRKFEWSSLPGHGRDPNTYCEHMTSAILQGMATFIPSKKLVSRTGDPIWWTPECSHAVLLKDKAWRAWRKQPGSITCKELFVQSVSAAASALQAAWSAWSKRLRTKLTAGSMNDKQWWCTLKKACGEKHQSDIALLVGDDGTEYVTPAAKADCLASYFANKCSLGTDDLKTDRLPASNSSVRPRPEFNHVHFRPATVRRCLSQLDTSKATGPDNIPAIVLKECATELSKPLAHLFSSCFSHGVQPELWKCARVVPVHKRASRTNYRNYRPVSLLSVCSKVMEKIVNEQLMNFLEKNQLLSCRQFGFRRGLGTSDLLTSVHHDWLQALGTGGCIQALAVDIAGAFDKVSHAGVLHKLAELGVCEKAFSWLKAYLNERSLHVVVNGQRSPDHLIKAGVPQGSILGPTLFLVYVNDAEACLSPGTEMCVYADDTTIYTVVTSHDAVASQAASLQQSVVALHEWGVRWRIKFEPSKSQIMTISHHRHHWHLPDVTFGGSVVPNSNQMKLLGVIFDSKLSFAAHIRQTALRANNRLRFLRKAARFLDRKGAATIYHGFVRPLLEYAPLVWMGAAQTHLRQLDRVQRRALHILGPNVLLQSLEARRTVAALTYLYKLMCLDGPPQLVSIVPPLRQPTTNPRTRSDLSHQGCHGYQLQSTLPNTASDFLRRSFPFCIIDEWNNLPLPLLARHPTLKSLQTFKVQVHHHLRHSRWEWATDSL